MDNKLIPSVRNSWKRAISRGREKIERMTAAEITRLSWARRVDNLGAVPEIYLPYLQAHLTRPEDFPGGVLTPTYAGFLRQENERLVVYLGDELHIVERLKDRIIPVVFPLETIDFIEMGAVLLKAWMTASGRDSDGLERSVTVKFNAVTEWLFAPIVERFRCGGGSRPEFPRAPQTAHTGLRTIDTLDSERRKFEVLEKSSFKFMNYARRSLLPGDRVIQHILQAEMLRPRLEAFGHPLLSGRVSTAHICILTNRELILIRDDPDSLKGCDEGRYGGIWTYAPLRRVAGVTVDTDRFGNLLLVLAMQGGSRVECLFAPEQREAVLRMGEAVEKVNHQRCE